MRSTSPMTKISTLFFLDWAHFKNSINKSVGHYSSGFQTCTFFLGFKKHLQRKSFLENQPVVEIYISSPSPWRGSPETGVYWDPPPVTPRSPLLWSGEHSCSKSWQFLRLWDTREGRAAAMVTWDTGQADGTTIPWLGRVLLWMFLLFCSDKQEFTFSI